MHRPKRKINAPKIYEPELQANKKMKEQVTHEQLKKKTLSTLKKQARHIKKSKLGEESDFHQMYHTSLPITTIKEQLEKLNKGVKSSSITKTISKISSIHSRFFLLLIPFHDVKLIILSNLVD